MALRFLRAFRLVPVPAALLLPVMALAACSSLAMPTGYTYEHEIYRTPPGPEAHPPKDANILATGQDTGSPAGTSVPVAMMPAGMSTGMSAGMKDIYTASAAADASGHWDAAAEELVGKILKDLGRPMEKVGVPGDDAFVPAMKAALRNHAIPVMDRPGDGPFVIQHQLNGTAVTIDFYSNHSSILTESGAAPVAGTP